MAAVPVASLHRFEVKIFPERIDQPQNLSLIITAMDQRLAHHLNAAFKLGLYNCVDLARKAATGKKSRKE